MSIPGVLCRGRGRRCASKRTSDFEQSLRRVALPVQCVKSNQIFLHYVRNSGPVCEFAAGLDIVVAPVLQVVVTPHSGRRQRWSAITPSNNTSRAIAA
eukprot:2012763-Amphidinium_carterae.1